ncbi:RNA polymerase I-specific transcription initiation factor RRN3 [Schizophyllum amplum]|uniref:RNA polymerase I-specific transcription initiation factor RRN3 n=1 Tax=Schizophyllum amplum TaxID=97359 RepID=A0A550CT11_9AGAR|nr:RNA polymerase I-specific transcription initiation factor RRN3 [Auriculariopsis ampla]
MESTKLSLEGFTKKPSAPTRKSASPAPAVVRRPIATNSRIRQDEQYRKDMYLAFVNNALQQKLNGNSEPYDELVGQFDPKRFDQESTPQTSQLRFWILALSHVVSRLERPHASLVEAIVNVPWTTMDSASVKSFTVFFGMLLSAKPEYLSLVLGKVAQGFTHQSGLQALDSAVPEGSSKPLTRRVVYDRLHSLLQHVLSLIPTLSSTLLPLLVHNFPHKRQSQVSQATYIRNLLRISGYCPELADKILATIVDRAIQIDVEIQVELEGLEDDEGDDTNLEQDLFEIDPFDTLIGQDGESSDSDSDDEDGGNLSDITSDGEEDLEEAQDVPTNVQHIQEMVTKLDAILTLVFDHFHHLHCAEPTSSSRSSSVSLELPPLPPISSPISPLVTPSLPLFPPSSPSPVLLALPPPPPQTPAARAALRRTQFHTLLAIFDRTILRTFKSRYTQFLLFWFASLDAELADLFAGVLVERALLRPDAPAVTRAAAASYIGSFVSRARYVDRDGARRVVTVLCGFLAAHLDALADNHSAAENTVWYAIAQAVFLIFCFRWRDLLEDEELVLEELGTRKWMPALDVLHRVVNAPLNPLRVCSQNVVMQFARVAHATNFLYCFTILEANRRSADDVTRRGRDAELHTFFPFDPYKLPKSGPYIQAVYREWASVAIGGDDDDEDGDEDREDENDRHESKSHETPACLAIPRAIQAQEGEDDDPTGLGQSLNAMSISPQAPIRAMVSA